MLSIKNISKSFGDVHALKNVSLDLKPGLFGLLGPNGAGKSTLMRTLATLQRPDTGEITLNGVDILTNPTAMRATLGYLPQDFGVYPKMSARALLDHIAVLKGVTNKSDPSVLIVDEPTAGLDPAERQRFLDLLSEQAETKIIILSTHIIEDVRDLCTDMAVMGNGQVVARGAPETLIARIADKVWRKQVSIYFPRRLAIICQARDLKPMGRRLSREVSLPHFYPLFSLEGFSPFQGFCATRPPTCWRLFMQPRFLREI